jgi:hypothetical protein
MMVCSCFFYLGKIKISICRGRRQLLLWTRSSDETAPNTDDAQPDTQLWLVSKDGSLREFGTLDVFKVKS